MQMLPTFATLAALAALAPAAQAAGNLVLNPANTQAQPGDVVVVDVRGSQFTDRVVGGGFDLAFNPAVLSLSSVLVDSVEWELVTSPGTIDNQAGTVSAVWFNAFAAPLPTGSFPIARLSFQALAPGFSGISLSANGSFPFVSDSIALIEVGFGSGGVSVSAVPELPAWAGMGLGLALLPWLRRRLAA